MKTLLLLRHAKSSWGNPGLADHDRPLNKRGKRDAPRIGELLRREELVPHLIISSTARRARVTAELVAEHSGYAGSLRLEADLYAAGAEAYLEGLANLPDEYERVMVVGHNPGLEELLEAIIGGYERLPTAALAEVRLPVQRWRDLNDETEGELVNLWRPKELSD
jgi:phosphohistidine phosphatase